MCISPKYQKLFIRRNSVEYLTEDKFGNTEVEFFSLIFERYRKYLNYIFMCIVNLFFKNSSWELHIDFNHVFPRVVAISRSDVRIGASIVCVLS